MVRDWFSSRIGPLQKERWYQPKGMRGLENKSYEEPMKLCYRHSCEFIVESWERL